MDPGGDRQLPSGAAGVPHGVNGSDGPGNDNIGDCHVAFLPEDHDVDADRRDPEADQRAPSGAAGVASGVNGDKDSSNVLPADGEPSALAAISGTACAPTDPGGDRQLPSGAAGVPHGVSGRNGAGNVRPSDSRDTASGEPFVQATAHGTTVTPGGSGSDRLAPSGAASVAPSPAGNGSCVNAPQSVTAAAGNFPRNNAYDQSGVLADAAVRGRAAHYPVSPPAPCNPGPPDSPSLRSTSRAERPPDEEARQDQRVPSRGDPCTFVPTMIRDALWKEE